MEQIVEAFARADAVVVLAGAGMGVDAGIPDFRGQSGIWTSEQDTFMRFASGDAFHERPLEAWNFYISRFLNYRNTPPHRGYFELRELLERRGLPTFVVTSNVDGHFEAAGYSRDRIYEIHGNLENIQCSNFCCRITHPMPRFTRLLESDDEMPACETCGAPMRPMVMMFNDPWFYPRFVNLQSMAYMNWEMNYTNILGIEIGAGTYVSSIRDFGFRRTAQVIRINPHQPGINRPQDISIPATAVGGIDTLVRLIGEI